MREILFRGKDPESGEWHYGYYVKRNDGDRGGLILEDYYLESYEIVKHETVGQYTGLTDKNGTKIFEGDILEGDLDDNLDLGAKWRSAVVMGKFGWLADDPTGPAPTPLDEFDIKEGEVIGNIHDNPELLEGEKNG